MEHKRPDEQLNTVTGRQDDLSLDAIMEEFGSNAPAAPGEEEEEVRIWQPREPEPASPAPPAAREEPAPPPEAEEAPEEEEEAVPFRIPRLALLPRKQQPEAEEEEEEEPPLTKEELQESYRKRFRRLLPMTAAGWCLMIMTLLCVGLYKAPWAFTDFMTVELCNLVTLCTLLVQGCLAFEPLLRGAGEALSGRFTVRTMSLVTVLAALFQGLTALRQPRLSLAVAGSLVAMVTLWSEYLLVSAKLRSLTLVMDMESPMAAARFPKVFREQDCLYRTEGDPEEMVRELEEVPGSEKAAGIAAFVLMLLSLAVAAILSLRAQADFLWAWTLLLLAACPLGALLAFARPYCIASKQLKACGAAISGYPGAKRLRGNTAAVITDDDLFPRQHLHLNGIKVFGSYSAELLLSYATALLERSGAGSLFRIFDEELSAENGRHFRTGDFRTYEAGGLGGEIQDNIVLLGGMGFMDLMKVKLPEKTRLREALYISVNGEAAGVFAISYRPSEAVRSGLSAILSCRDITPVLATQDPLLTPAMLKEKYGVPVDLLDYPTGKDRAMLSETVRGKGEQGALLARDSFLSFAAAVSWARQIVRSAKAAAVLAIVGACLGWFLMTTMTVAQAADAAGALEMLVYQALWLLPVGLLTGRLKK